MDALHNLDECKSTKYNIANRKILIFLLQSTKRQLGYVSFSTMFRHDVSRNLISITTAQCKIVLNLK